MKKREELLRQLEQLGPALRRRFEGGDHDGTVMSHFGNVTLHQLGALRHLKDGPLTMNELAARVHISPSAATQLVDRLVQHGLVDRVPDADDRRVLRVALSASASEVVKSFEDQRRRQFAELLSVLDAAELTALVGLAERVANAPAAPRSAPHSASGDTA